MTFTILIGGPIVDDPKVSLMFSPASFGLPVCSSLQLVLEEANFRNLDLNINLLATDFFFKF